MALSSRNALVTHPRLPLDGRCGHRRRSTAKCGPWPEADFTSPTPRCSARLPRDAHVCRSYRAILQPMTRAQKRRRLGCSAPQQCPGRSPIPCGPVRASGDHALALQRGGSRRDCDAVVWWLSVEASALTQRVRRLRFYGGQGAQATLAYSEVARRPLAEGSASRLCVAP